MNKKIFTTLLSIIIVTGITFSSTGAWVGLTAQLGDVLNTAKWNEMITVLNTKLETNNIVAGNGISVSTSGSDVTISRSSSSNVTSENLTIADGACATATTIPYNTYINAFVDQTITTGGTPGAEAVPTGTIDPDNTSTGDASMIDNSYTNLVYNNSSQGSANDSLPGINLGASVPLHTVRLHWWNPASYGTTNGTIQGSNNGTNWTNLVTGIVKNTGATGDTTDHVISGSWQYIRFFNVTGQNADWIVLSETEAFTVGTPGTTTTENIHISDYDIQIRNDAGNLELCNNSGTSQDVEVNSIQ